MVYDNVCAQLTMVDPWMALCVELFLDPALTKWSCGSPLARRGQVYTCRTAGESIYINFQIEEGAYQ